MMRIFRKEQAGAAVEFALVLPLLVGLLAAAIGVGVLALERNATERATDEIAFIAASSDPIDPARLEALFGDLSGAGAPSEYRIFGRIFIKTSDPGIDPIEIFDPGHQGLLSGPDIAPRITGNPLPELAENDKVLVLEAFRRHRLFAGVAPVSYSRRVIRLEMPPAVGNPSGAKAG